MNLAVVLTFQDGDKFFHTYLQFSCFTEKPEVECTQECHFPPIAPDSHVIY